MALARWWKIDFHTHTPESTCFYNKEITPKQWVQAALDKGLDAVVVSDHNSLNWIELLRIASKEIYDETGKKLYIIPGIELCVGSSFVHTLILFDLNMSIDEMEGIISEAGLPRIKWGNTENTVEEANLGRIIEKNRGKLLVIPAHFNKNKGLGKELGQNGIAEFVKKISIDAIEVRDEEDCREVENKIANKIIPQIAMITGSDNPGKKKGHAIHGLGSKVTYVKMSEVSLEGVRQALLDWTTRIIVKVEPGETEEELNEVEYNYISGINIKNLKHVNDLNMRFSPHLNCIIGGRGTGKSTIIEMIRLGIKQEINKGKKASTIIDNTYTNDSSIELFYDFGQISKYAVKVEGNKKNKQWVYRDKTGVIENYPDFPVAIYGQKEIFELVEDDTNADKIEKSPLLSIIDNNIITDRIEADKGINSIKEDLISKTRELNDIRNEIKDIPKLKAEIELATSRLEKFKESGLIEKRNKYYQNEEVIRKVEGTLEGYIKLVENAYEDISHMVKNSVDEINEQIEKTYQDDEVHKKEVEEYLGRFLLLQQRLSEGILSGLVETKRLSGEVQNSNLRQYTNALKDEYTRLKEDLDTAGEDYQKIENNITIQTKRLAELEARKSRANELEEEIMEGIDKFLIKNKELTTLREAVIAGINESSDNINIEIKHLSHGERWIYNIRSELGKTTSYDSYFDKIYSEIFKDGVLNENKYKEWLKYLLMTNTGNIKEFLGEESITDSRFEEVWTNKYKKQSLYTLFTVVPEDRIEIKITDEAGEININEGSPGQKSAAILAFILNQGSEPIIIDQPEDDLDNSLIISLVVDTVRKLKNRRQIIIVTHNPNIPVLGDAEGIIILDRDKDSKVIFKNNKKTGCIEEKLIKKGICEIMEGGLTAFKRRERKYRFIN